jgi:hypothetical protein
MTTAMTMVIMMTMDTTKMTGIMIAGGTIITPAPTMAVIRLRMPASLRSAGTAPVTCPSCPTSVPAAGLAFPKALPAMHAGPIFRLHQNSVRSAGPEKAEPIDSKPMGAVIVKDICLTQIYRDEEECWESALLNRKKKTKAKSGSGKKRGRKLKAMGSGDRNQASSGGATSEPGR